MMMSDIRRIYVEKKAGFDVEASHMLADLRESLGVECLTRVRIFQRYDISGMTDEEYAQARGLVFSEPTMDECWDDEMPEVKGRAFAVEYLPGQYDQRADSAAQCVQLLTQKDMPTIATARVIVLEGEVDDSQFAAVKKYLINPVESREARLDKPETLDAGTVVPPDVKVLDGFTCMDENGLENMLKDMGLAMDLDDLKCVQTYFKDEEKRDPSLTEIKVIDTYWSDHCRHTTFNTRLKDVAFDDGKFNEAAKEAWNEYIKVREVLYAGKDKPVSLMDIATVGMKEMRRSGKLDDLDASEEINACSVRVDVDVDGEVEPWLVMFKNETHNHPTEIEPFGGAATCLGGAIRDPLSGRSYVYQAMRVTGSADPRTPIEDTLSGKLPQKKITTSAASGYSSYGNQIGLATGKVAEIYHPGYVAKRMEIGAVIGAAPAENVVRKRPQPSDVILLVGGRTGRDGCGGATGSSKAHTEDSLLSCGAEVQKGNAPTERKLQRLFRRPEASRLIKRCNDFGAGGVSVAIGELAEGLDINLDAVPRKYDGLDGTELAISESQERMAVVLDKDDVEKFQAMAAEENLESTVVAIVTDDRRLTMKWRGKTIVGLSRDFLDTNGAVKTTSARVSAPEESGFFSKETVSGRDVRERWLSNLRDLNVCSQKGLCEKFDSTIGAATVVMPFGGRYQLTPSDAMVAKVPVLGGKTTTGTLMSFGFNPYLSEWSPFHGAAYAVIEALTKVASTGGNWRRSRLTLQEYFERVNSDPSRWGKPLAALLGALWAQLKLEIPAIGGKDSVSGTFKDMDVPPTLVAFAMAPVDVREVISTELKATDSDLWLLSTGRGSDELPDLDMWKANMDGLYELVKKGMVRSACSVGIGGAAAAVSKMCFGNMIGADIDGIDEAALYVASYGDVVVEAGADAAASLTGLNAVRIGKTKKDASIRFGGMELSLEEAVEAWREPLEKIFPTRAKGCGMDIPTISDARRSSYRPKVKVARPLVFIPAFPGTNCEYDTAAAFERAGARTEVFVIKNQSPHDVEDSVKALQDAINRAQIVAIPGGFSAGDEPEGSGKFIATMFRNPRVKDAITSLLNERDGLMLGICNGFQALIKLGLVPYGEIRPLTAKDPTLTFNSIGRHVSQMVYTRVASTLSPWLAGCEVGDVYTVPVSHGEGRFVADEQTLQTLKANGQIATQYVDLAKNPSDDTTFNPNGSVWAIEGITSLDGRVFGKMAHSERRGNCVIKNVPGEKDQRIFESGVAYFD